MDIPPWHVGHVIKKVMMSAQPKEITRTELAARANKRPMTITHLLKGGPVEDDTLEAVCRVLGVTKAELYAEVDRSNGRGRLLAMPEERKGRRITDRDQAEIDADMYARRILRLVHSAQTTIYNVIRSFEEAYGLVKSSNDR